jgi:hypothetical protein
MNNIHGSLVLAGIATDGIVIAADSRVVIRSADGQTSLGYFDGFPKIQVLKERYPISTVGSTLIGGYFINTLIGDFNRDEIEDIDINASFNRFRNGLLAIRPDFTNKFIGAAYANGNPQMYVFTNELIFSYPVGITGSEVDLFPYTEKLDGLTLTSEDLRQAFEEIIYQYAKDKNKEFEIGGPVSVVEIDINNQVTWLQNDLTHNNILGRTEFINAIKGGYFNLIPVNGLTIEEVLEQIKE